MMDWNKIEALLIRDLEPEVLVTSEDFEMTRNISLAPGSVIPRRLNGYCLVCRYPVIDGVVSAP